MDKYDLIVVGAGIGGALSAKIAAAKDFKVCLIDQKPEKKIGDKICGEAMGKHHFDNLGLAPPTGDELASIVKGIDIFSPDKKTIFRIEEEKLHGYMINRYELGQRFLQEALDSGVELHHSTQVLNPLIEKSFIKGVRAKNGSPKKLREFIGSIVIDSSGMDAIIRKQVPDDWIFERNLSGEDTAILYQEIREVSDIKEPAYPQIYLNQTISPGGYYWIFPKGQNIVNVGLGLQMKEGFLNPRKLFYNDLLSEPFFNNSKKIRGGGGFVSTRRPLNTMVGNGVLFIGDAASQPSPVSGGGIGPSMEAGYLAAKVACKAIEQSDVSQRGMWDYNLEYMTQYGGKSAGLDIFRIFLQKCSNEDLDYGMYNKLIKEDDLLKASIGENLKLNITDKAQRVFRGLRRFSFLKALAMTADKMKAIKELYSQFPQPQDHVQWSQKVESLVKEMKNMSI